MRRAALVFAAAVSTAIASPASAGQLAVGAGSSLELGTASLDLGCADLAVAGALFAGSVGLTGVRHLSIDPAGELHGEAAAVEVAGDWDAAGTFDAGTGSVQLVDGCGLASSVIAGDASFATLAMTTATGKLYQFAAGSTQTVTGSLSLLGAAGNLLTIRSTVGGSPAFLEVQGSGSGDFVDVEDNDASAGNPIVLGANSVAGSNTPGWTFLAAVPSVSLLGRILAALLVLGAGLRRLGSGGVGAARREGRG